MSAPFVEFHDVSFRYETSSIPLLERLSFRLSRGWTGVVGPNGSGKTTLLRLAANELTPGSGSLFRSGPAICCPQRTDDPPEEFGAFLRATDGKSRALGGRMEIEPSWLHRWESLSHGERRRAQIGTALWREPEILAIDEPTNHLDTEARDMLIAGLSSFRGVGLLVSHDRDLLDRLCDRCLFLDPPEVTLRPGSYTQGAEQTEMEEKRIRSQLALARKEHKRLRREQRRRRVEAEKSKRRLSKRGIALKDSDARAKIDAARITGKDARAGQQLRQLDGRLERARQKEESLEAKRTKKTGIWVPGERSKRDHLFQLPEREIELGGGRILRIPNLAMRPDDRVALTGPNGGGKSTLIRSIVENLTLPAERVTYLPQEVRLEDSQRILTEARNLPRDRLGTMMTVVSRLGSRPEPLLESDEPSPGETRKVLLAMGIAKTPHLIIMDEPTNHMDLPSVECLEDALEGCPCGLLLVSHDLRFLTRLTDRRWCIHRDMGAEGGHILEVGTFDPAGA